MTLGLNDYQLKALSTAVYPKDQGKEYTILGLVGEAGEVANRYKKLVRKWPEDNAVLFDAYHDLADELGDVLWYLAAVAHELGYTLEDIASMNLSKLALRQSKGTLDSRGER